MRKRKGEVVRSLTFEEVENLVECPYCKAGKGQFCKDKKPSGRPPEKPHLSRAKKAFESLGMEVK